MVDDNNLSAIMAEWLNHKPKADPNVYIFRSSKHHKIAFIQNINSDTIS